MKKNNSDTSKKAKKRIIIESFIVLFLVISPFVFKLHEYFSEDPDATINFLGFTIDKNGFPNLNMYAWFMLGKIVPLYLLVMWFFTCKHWWYHSILIPITMYAFQIFEGIYSEDNYVDTENLLWLLPVCMVVIPFVYFIRIKLYDKHVHGIDLEAMDAELKALREKQNQESINEQTANTDEVIQTEKTTEENSEPKQYRTLAEKIDHKLSTQNLESGVRQFQHNLKNWLHLKF